MILTLDQTEAAIDGALAKGANNRMQQLTIAVLDAGEHMLAFRRLDDSGILRPKTAIGKTYGPLGF